MTKTIRQSKNTSTKKFKKIKKNLNSQHKKNTPYIATRESYGLVLEYLSEDLLRTGSVTIVINDDEILPNNAIIIENTEYGTCCFCNGKCNISSQACSTCLRSGKYF